MSAKNQHDEDLPPMRVQVRERAMVAARLRRALEQGRLKLEEYVARLEAACGAVTYGDLSVLCADLPTAYQAAEWWDEPRAPAFGPDGAGVIAGALQGTPRQVSLLRQIHVYIGEHLADPALTPATIASAHFISVRYLFALFSGQRMTVSALIRGLRLERVRQDLADPSLADQAVGSIGTRWGFSSAAHFSRVFCHAHGIPPGEYRLLTAQEPARPGR